MKTLFDLDQIKGNSQKNKYIKHYNVRSCVYHGSMDNRNKSRLKNCKDLLEDEKLKMKLPYVCYYCGEDEPNKLVTDHLIPRIKGEGDYGENLVPACRYCNSSKGGKDMLEWMKRKEINPSVLVLRRYLKLAILFCN